MIKDPDPGQEGHTKEWADRARVELDPWEDVQKPASPNQSPLDQTTQEKPVGKKDAENPAY